MISKRIKRKAAPQESVRQFALNTSKGVDSSKSPTHFDTVCYAENLIANPDGSVSLRKPLTYVDNSIQPVGAVPHYLYDNSSKIIIEGSRLYIVNSEGELQNFKLTYDTGTATYRSPVLITEYHTELIDGIVPESELSVVNLSTATVLGNCNVALTTLFGPDSVDLNLYESGMLPTYFPRYIHIRYDASEKVWVLDVKCPEPNTLNSPDATFPFNPNLTLDTPLSLRDEYDCSVPSIKGIVAYATARPNVFGDLEYIAGSISPEASEVSTGSAPHSIRFNSGSYVYSRQVSMSFGPSNNRKSLGNIECTVNIAIGPIVEGDRAIDLELICTVTPNASPRHTLAVNLDLECQVKYQRDLSSLSVYSLDIQLSKSATYDLDNLTESPYTYTATKRFHGSDYGFYPYGISTTINWNATRKSSLVQTISVESITESAKQLRPRILTAIRTPNDTASTSTVFLKAFGQLPKASSEYYATWEVSRDGIHWDAWEDFDFSPKRIAVRELSDTYTPDRFVDGDTPNPAVYNTRYYYLFSANRPSDAAMNTVGAVTINRVDVIPVTITHDTVGKQFRFKVIAVEELAKDDVEASEGYDPSKGLEYRVLATVSQMNYTPVFKNKFEFFDIEFGNTVYGKKLYYQKSIYSYGYEKFFNNIFASDIDSFISPLYNIIDLDTYASDVVTSVFPWRNYVMSSTSNAIYLHTKTDSGFLTKTVNTSIGIPQEDSRCCRTVLNGILFKSGSKVYQLFPNLYAGDDSTLNLTEISKPVEDVLAEYVADWQPPFAFSTDSEYVLMLPGKNSTQCLRYDYTSKLWTVCRYPIVATGYSLKSINDIRIFGIYNGEYSAEFKFDSDAVSDIYGDVLYERTVPIEFTWDTGQKTDSIALTKQFVESKLMFATEDTLEAFPMSLTVAIDGDPHVTTMDVSSDAPFWKEDGSIGVANTAFRLGNSESVNVFRQLVVRYSGKGKSIRHILTGSPSSNFRLYETYIRYKLLKNKH